MIVHLDSMKIKIKKLFICGKIFNYKIDQNKKKWHWNSANHALFNEGTLGEEYYIDPSCFVAVTITKSENYSMKLTNTNSNSIDFGGWNTL